MSGNPGCSVPSFIQPSLPHNLPPPLPHPSISPPPPLALVWQSTVAGPRGPPGRPAVPCVGVAGRRGVGAAPTPRHWMEAHPVRGRTSRKVPVWPPVQVTPRQPCLSCGAWLPVASFLHFFASRSHHFIFILAAFLYQHSVFFFLRCQALLLPAVRPLTPQRQSLLVCTVRLHAKSDLLLSHFVHIPLYLLHYMQTPLFFQRPVCLRRHGYSHVILSLLFAAQIM